MLCPATGGCNGLSYTMNYAETKPKFDEEVNEKGEHTSLLAEHFQLGVGGVLESALSLESSLIVLLCICLVC